MKFFISCIQRFGLGLIALPVLIISWEATAAPIQVVTTTQDIAVLVQAVGGGQVQVISLTQGYQDTHFVQAKPSLMLTLHEADLLIYQGLELEVGWLPLLLQGARNPKLLLGQPGNLDLSLAVDPIEIPQSRLDRSMGDVHAFGNPHYTLDPANIKPMVFLIADHLSELLPQHAETFKNHRNEFIQRFEPRLAEWKNRMAPFTGTQVVTYHRTWSYFLKFFGLKRIGTVEPKPGIQPTPSHLADLARDMKRHDVRVILQANYYQDRFSRLLAEKTGAKVLMLPPGVGGVPEARDTAALFDYLVNQMTKALAHDE